MEIHILQIEPIVMGVGKYACPICQKVSKNNANCVRHIRIHTGEKPYNCKFCDKKFVQNHNKTMHERTHTSDKPYYACRFCKKKFTQLHNRKKHEKIYHKTELQGLSKEIPKSVPDFV